MRNISISKLIIALLVLLVAGSDSNLLAQTPIEFRGNRQYRRRGLMNGNLVHTLFWNYGEIGDYPHEPSGSWPTPEAHYLDDITLIVSVEVENRDGVLIHPMETQYREFVDTSPEGVPWGFEPRPYWFNMDARENQSPAMSNDPITWPENWLDKPSDWSGYWNGYFGKGIFNAQLETFFVFGDDADKEVNEDMNYYADDRDTTRGGLGLVVEMRGFQWSQVLAEDCIFWLYTINNESSHDYTKSYFTQYIDWGIGGVQGQSGIQNIGEYDVDLDIAFAYAPPGSIGDRGWIIGYAGYAFLESPGISGDLKDNDGDGIIDESRESDGPGDFLGVYPYGFDESARNSFYNFYNRYPSAHWSEDENCDWVGYTDANGNGDWDSDEPLNDDVGADGVSPFDAHYTGPDVGEGDGKPTDGEPNYNATDPDESDQIGLTGFEIFPVHYYELTNDEESWSVFSRALRPYNEIEQPNNLAMFFSSGPFPLNAGRTERYSMALLFGEDRDDLTKNKRTVQQIYNADYRFSRPPLKPTLELIAGDNEVTLVWDTIAESSYDPFIQEYDFEGYMIYRSTEPQFLEDKVITDSYGNFTYRKPIAQFDLIDGKKGPHPIDIFGIKFNLGEDTGLRHAYIDKDVKNGQTYFYAVVSYDYGLYFYDENGVEGIQPSECSAIVSVNALGEVTSTDINTGVVTPRPAAAGYIPAEVEDNVEHNGPGTGSIIVDIVQKHKLASGSTIYELAFIEDTKHHTAKYPYYSVRDMAIADTLQIDTVSIDPLVIESSWVHVFLADSIPVLTYGAESPIIDGLTFTVYNDTLIEISDESRMLEGEFDYAVRIRINPDNEDVAGYRLNIEQPADYIISFHDTIYTYSTSAFGKRSLPSSVGIYNVTDSIDAPFYIADLDKDGQYSHGDDIGILVPDDDFIFKYYTTWMLRFEAKFELDTVIVDGVAHADTNWLTVDPPSDGDRYYLATTKPFRSGDVFRFTLQGADSSDVLAKSELDDIYVVPDPYVVTASWEPANTYRFGRGERRLHFFNLPRICTIRIYNLRGHLIDTIEHVSSADDGMAPWDILSKDDNEIAYGIYIYHVEAPGIGEKIGRFAVIK